MEENLYMPGKNSFKKAHNFGCTLCERDNQQLNGVALLIADPPWTSSSNMSNTLSCLVPMGTLQIIKKYINLIIRRCNFEKCECNYDKIRIGDEVEFHLYKSLSNNLDALNIEFLKNKLLSELDSIFQKQIKIELIYYITKKNIINT